MPSSVILIAAAVAWLCALILLFAASRPPRVGALVERAFLAVALALFGTVYGVVAANTDFGFALLDNETARTIIRSAVVVLVGVLPLLWVLFWVTGRLGTSENAAALDRIEAALERNTAISQEGVETAKAAFDVGNHVAAKFDQVQEVSRIQSEALAAHGAILVEQGADRAEALETAHHVQETVDATAEKVDEIHDATVHTDVPA